MLRSSGSRSILPSDVAGADQHVLLLPALFGFPQPILLQLGKQPKPSRVTPLSSRLVSGTQNFILATGDAAQYLPRRIRARTRDNPRDNDDGPSATRRGAARRGAISSEVELRIPHHQHAAGAAPFVRLSSQTAPGSTPLADGDGTPTTTPCTPRRHYCALRGTSGLPCCWGVPGLPGLPG
jgi:hypothetical protein